MFDVIKLFGYNCKLIKNLQVAIKLIIIICFIVWCHSLDVGVGPSQFVGSKLESRQDDLICVSHESCCVL